MRWLRRLFRGKNKARVRPGAPSARPMLEVLEDRCQPSASGVTEFTLPSTFCRPEHITAGPDGNLWFTDQYADPAGHRGKIGRITPAGAVTEFTLPTDYFTPGDIAAGPDGNVWFTERSQFTPGLGKIGRITPSGSITEFTLPAPPALVALVNPDSYATALSAGPDGNVWFTDQNNRLIGRITPQGTITEFPLPRPTSLLGPLSAGAFPDGITAGPDGALWFTEMINTGVNVGYAVGRIAPDGTVTTPASLQLVPTGIVTGADGNLWVQEGTGPGGAPLGRLARISPQGTVTEYTITPSGRLDGIAAGPDGRIWLIDAADNQVVRVDRNGSVRDTFAVPTAGSSPAGIAAGPPNVVWFTEYDAGKIGVVTPSADANVAYVGAVYQDMLGRSGTQAELNAWLPVLVAQGEAGLVRALDQSAEARDRLVRGWYSQYLGRPPQAGEEQGFADALAAGVPSDLLLSLLLASDEFYTHAAAVVGTPASAPTFVRALYRLLDHRDARPEELPSLTGVALTAAGRQAAALQVLRSPEYRAAAVAQLYVQLLHRPASAAEASAWAGSGLDLRDVARALESSYEKFALGRSGADDNQHFIAALYQDALKRAPGADELASWEQALLRFGSAVVVRAIERSPEAYTRGVRDLYAAVLGRPAVNGEEQGLVRALLAGTMTEEQVIAALAGSDEFLARAVGSANPSLANLAFIQGMYSGLLHRAPSPAELAYWQGLLPFLGRAGVVLRLLQSPEFRLDEVANFYAALHRPNPPTAAELSAWAFSGMTLEVVHEAILASYEFFLNG